MVGTSIFFIATFFQKRGEKNKWGVGNGKWRPKIISYIEEIKINGSTHKTSSYFISKVAAKRHNIQQ